MEFRPMPKTPRLSREVVITEKIDGTNASVFIEAVPKPGEFSPDWPSPEPHPARIASWYGLDGSLWEIRAGSRTRWITPKDDNYGFATWVLANVEQLKKLGPGHHFGEWWGRGINRNYGLTDRRFSLFNVGRWVPYQSGFAGDECPPCCSLVPVLYRGDFVLDAMGDALARLVREGSVAAPGFMDPEGIMLYHTAADQLFKKTIKGDEAGKSHEGHVAKPPKQPRIKDPSKGGRRQGPTLDHKGPWRRSTDKVEEHTQSA